MSDYDHSKVYERIKSAWESIGCKNARQFSEYARQRGVNISEGKITNWKNSGHVPEISSLMDICNLCGCDIDYLLGKIECKTRDIADIQRETGLSEEACKIITCNDSPVYYTDEKKDERRALLLSEQQKHLGWFIEHGLMKILADAADCIDFENPDNSRLCFVPGSLYPMLSDSFDIAVRIARTVTDRQSEYINRIAYNLIDMKPSQVRDIQRSLQENVPKYDFDIYEFNDFDDYVQYAADDRKLKQDARDIIANVAEALAGLSFDYYQAKYEIQLNLQIAVNKFNGLLADYRTEKQENRESGESENEEH